MNLLDRIKELYAGRQLSKELTNQIRTRKTISIDDAKTIGVIYSIQDEETYKVIHSFLKSLKAEQKTVIALGYLDDAKFPSFLNQSIYNSIFNQKDLNWYKKPVNQYVNNFLKENFDLLINISLKEYYPLLYVAANSKAYMKVGRYNDKYTECYDLMIKVEDSVDQVEYLGHVQHYLNLFNKSIVHEQ